MCDTFGYSLRNLSMPGTLLSSDPHHAVTFVTNHDDERSNPIVNEKLMAYAFILTHEGYPCVFWQDYFTYGLAREGQRSGIAALVEVHEKYAGGISSVIWNDDDLYIMQREGYGSQPGCILVLNNKGYEWNGAWAQTRWGTTKFVPMAWCGKNDAGIPQEKWTLDNGWGEFYAPPRGYAVYVPA